MTERWQRVEDLFHQAGAIEPAGRSEFLKKACGDDLDLRREVEALLSQQITHGFMDTPALEGLARDLARDGTRIAAGRTIGSYTIGSLIGRGGMGEVYRARDEQLGRDVAVKVLPDSLALDPDRIRRLDREARLLATLNHPNVATIHRLEELEGRQLLVLELVEGETLEDRLRRARIRKSGPSLPIREALEIALQVAEGLEAAHEAGIVHRDLKPANIKITPDGRVKILDFGLARAIGAWPDGSVESAEHPGASAEQSQPAGTAAYMSPEQARGEAVDRRTDIWAFGLVLYEMLTGAPAFGGTTANECLAHVLEDAVDFDKLPPDTPPLVERLIRRTLERNPRSRLQHIGDAKFEIADALSGAMPGMASRVVATGPSSRRTWAGVGVLALVAAALGSIVTLQVLPRSTPAVARALIGPLPVSDFGRPWNASLAISPDGVRVAYETAHQIYLRAMDGLEFVAVASGTDPFFSPDGSWLGFFGPDGLSKVSVRGGPPVLMAAMALHTGAAGRSAGGAWSSDGTIVFATGRGLFRASADGTEEAQLLIAPSAGEVFAWPRFLPDGRSVLFSRVRGGTPGSGDLARLDLDSMTTRTVLSGGVGGVPLPGGYLAYATGAHLGAVRFDPKESLVYGAPVPIPDVDILVSGPYLRPVFAASPKGTLVYLPPGNSGIPRNLVWVDADGHQEPVAGVPPGTISYARVSPSGDRLALNMWDRAGTERRIWLLDLEGGMASLVSGRSAGGSAFEDLLPQWHPDGQRIFFSSNRTGAFQVYSVAADGAGPERLLIDDPDVQIPYRIDAANRLLFFKGPFPTSDVGLLDLRHPEAGPTWVLNQPWGEVNAVLSDDNRWIAFESNESGGQYEIYVRPFPNVDGSRIQVSDGGGRQPLWSPRDPHVLHYRRPDGAMMAVRFDDSPDFRVVAVRELFPGTGFRLGDSGWTYDVSPTDGRFLLLGAGRTPSLAVPAIHATFNWLEEIQVLLPSD